MASEKFLVSMDILMSLRSCRGSVRWPCELHASDISKVEAFSDKLIIERHNGQTLVLLLPSKTKFSPACIKFAVSASGSLDFLVDLPEESDKECIVSSLAEEMRSLMFVSSLQDKLQKKKLLPACKECKSALSDDLIYFERVLPLPSADNWDAAVDDWYCHAHGDDTKKLKTHANCPGAADCFYTEMFLVVSKNLLTKVEIENSSSVTCTSCSNILGSTDKRGMKVWRHEILWQLEAHDLDTGSEVETIRQSIHETIVDVIDEVTGGEFSHQCRLVFVGPYSPKKFLYLTLLNSRLVNLYSTEDAFHQVSKFFVQERIENSEGTLEKDLKKTKFTPFELRLKSRTGIQVMYRLFEEENEETELWYSDVYVQMVPCSDKFFSYLRQVLISSKVNAVKHNSDELLDVGFITRL